MGAGRPKGPRPLGYKASAVVEDSLVRLSTIRRMAERIDSAAESSNYPLVVALSAAIRKEAQAAASALGNAALGRY